MILQFIKIYPEDSEDGSSKDVGLRRLFCDFICISLLISLARDTDSLELQVRTMFLGPRSARVNQSMHVASKLSRSPYLCQRLQITSCCSDRTPSRWC